MKMPILLVSILVYKKLAKEKAVIQSISLRGIIFMLKYRTLFIEKRVTSCKRDKMLIVLVIAIHFSKRKVYPYDLFKKL